MFTFRFESSVLSLLIKITSSLRRAGKIAVLSHCITDKICGNTRTCLFESDYHPLRSARTSKVFVVSLWISPGHMLLPSSHWVVEEVPITGSFLNMVGMEWVIGALSSHWSLWVPGFHDHWLHRFMGAGRSGRAGAGDPGQVGLPLAVRRKCSVWFLLYCWMWITVKAALATEYFFRPLWTRHLQGWGRRSRSRCNTSDRSVEKPRGSFWNVWGHSCRGQPRVPRVHRYWVLLSVLLMMWSFAVCLWW